MLEKKPDLALKNKKGQTAIDITNSKIIISLFWHYFSGNEETKKDQPNQTPDPAKKSPTQKVSSKALVTPTAVNTPTTIPPKIAVELPASGKKPAPTSKDVVKDIKIKTPELAKVAETRLKEKKAILIGPKPTKKVVLYLVDFL